jgi:hypothetical protein
MQAYKAQVALRERMSQSLAKKFEEENLTLEQKAKLARKWDKVLKQKYAFQFMLDLMERQKGEEKESLAGAISSSI